MRLFFALCPGELRDSGGCSCLPAAQRARPPVPAWLHGRSCGEGEGSSMILSGYAFTGEPGQRVSICECRPVALYYVLSCL